MYHVEYVFIVSASNNHFLKLKSPPSQTWEVTGIKNRKWQKGAVWEQFHAQGTRKLSWVTLLMHLGPWRDAWFLLFGSPYFLSLEHPQTRWAMKTLLAHHLEIAFLTFSEADSFSVWPPEILIQVQLHTCANFFARPFTKRGKRKFSCTEHNLNNPQYLLARLP